MGFIGLISVFLKNPNRIPVFFGGFVSPGQGAPFEERDISARF
jgi:hypothetical protein